MKTAAKCLSEVATRHVAAYLDGLGADQAADRADDIVDLVLDTLAEPSRDMIEAGREELAHALPIGAPHRLPLGVLSSAYQRALVRAIWRAMLERAER